MTPLAARLTKQLTLPMKERDQFWSANSNLLRSSLSDIHCFDFTEILPLLNELSESLQQRFGRYSRMEDVPDEADDFIGSLSFLPAPKTWLEWNHPLAGRMAFLLEEVRAETAASATIFWDRAASSLGFISLTSSDYHRTGGIVALPKVFESWRAPRAVDMNGRALDAVDALIGLPHLVLVAINSPRILGSRQIMPNRGLERRLVKHFGVGKFPLHAWTDLKLEVTKPIEIDDGEVHEAHLTGRRALHFCRKHIRIRNGKFEYVRAHWRGDPAIGIKQTRYTVTP